MKEILDFLTDVKIFYLATESGGTPHVRPMGFVMEYQNKLTFSTSNEKAMFRQLSENPNVEISCVDSDRNTLRIRGRAVVCTTEDAQRKAFEITPFLSSIYSVGDGRFELFYLEDIKAECFTISGEKKIIAA
jgi:uncharacterized pyridoxamine 5'-phosphate oxidase family protein